MRPQAEAGLEKLQHCTSRQVDRRKVRCWVLGGLRGCRTFELVSHRGLGDLRENRCDADGDERRGPGCEGEGDEEMKSEARGAASTARDCTWAPYREQNRRNGLDRKALSLLQRKYTSAIPFPWHLSRGKRCDAIALRPHLPMPSCRSGESLVVATGTDRTLSSLSLYWDHAVQRPHSQRASPSPGNICLGKLVVQPRHATPPGQIPSFEI
ncbi:hypothetical protein JHW43_001649 [Diplocarpon mali]|nr:hypothetical protein JHW43_001649 [Diplocarpon mali]